MVSIWILTLERLSYYCCCCCCCYRLRLNRSCRSTHRTMSCLIRQPLPAVASKILQFSRPSQTVCVDPSCVECIPIFSPVPECSMRFCCTFNNPTIVNILTYIRKKKKKTNVYIENEKKSSYKSQDSCLYLQQFSTQHFIEIFGGKCDAAVEFFPFEM